MKKILGILVVIIIVIILLSLGIGLGLGSGSGNGSGKTNDDKRSSMVENEDKSATEVVEEPKVEETNAHEDDSEGAVFSITVVESDYFYNNARIKLEDFIDILNETEGDLVVEIKEDKASLKAYNKLVDALEEMNVKFVEK